MILCVFNFKLEIKNLISKLYLKTIFNFIKLLFKNTV